MESLFLQDTRSTVILFGIIVGFFFSWLVLSGLWMKFANSLCGGTPVGMLRATLAVLVSMTLSCVVSVLAAGFQPNDPPYVSAIYGVLGAVLGISAVLIQNPLRAFLTYLVHSFLQIVSAIGFAIAFIFIVSMLVPADQLEKINADLQNIARKGNSENNGDVQGWLVSDEGLNKDLDESQVTTVKESFIQKKRELKEAPVGTKEKLQLGDGVQPNPFAQ